MTITFTAQDGILVRTDTNKLNNGIVEDVICTFTFVDDYDEPEVLIRYGFDYEYLELANGSCTLPQDVFECPTLTLQLISDDKESLPCVVAITNIKSPKYIAPKGSIELTQNGTYNIADKATAIVNVEDTPTPSQEKSVTINSNTTTEVTPDEGNLLSKVTITTNVPNPTLTGNAVVGNVLKDKTFYAADYTKLTGTIETYDGATSITSNQTLNLAGKYCDKDLVVNVPSVTEVSTSAGMDALLVEANVGKYYKYVGTTDDKYTNGDIYQVESE